ncbi:MULTISPECIES: HAD hydrolase-like protein [Glutamicibacter]|uniref:HAD hydrolase-like protein n=1 Tax=Glutamicibacter TaxID=1742989 RepID=UPI001EF9003B|nr:HAD hydrolase-like protein [Glutamicibacter nicotianae]MBM7768727.1 phosphoglycolate phosphatase [Glutamicibacter nicotianae]
MSVTSVLFDLDGTLVDPAGAITSGIRHAVTSHGLADPGEARVEALVGPPLQIGLRTLDGVTDDNIGSIIAAYRARYADTGMAESVIYPGMVPLLDALRSAGIHVAVTTAKPINIARQLIARKGLDEHLDAIHGNADEHGSMGSSKTHIVAKALEHGQLDPERSVVVGDRHYDWDAARENSVASIGVAWGFAQGDELQQADAIAVTARDLAVLLLGAERANTINFDEDFMQEGAK